MFAPIWTSQITALQKQTEKPRAVAESSASRDCGQAGGDRQEETEQTSIVFYYFLKCKHAYLWRELVAACKCSAASHGTLVMMQSGTLVFRLSDKGSFDWLGHVGMGRLSFLWKHIHAGMPSSFPKDCPYSWLQCLGHCLEHFGLKVIKDLLVSCFMSSVTDCRPC